MATFFARFVALTAVLLAVSGCNGWPMMSEHDVTSTKAAPRHLPDGWHSEVLPGSSPPRQLVGLRREATVEPALLQLVVVPGSGCTGFAPFAARYFQGLTRARVLVLHKPYSDIFAGSAPAECSPDFVQYDSLSAWRDDAVAALQYVAGHDNHQLPTIVLGISEGAEIVPHLIHAVDNPIGMLFVSAAGLDPSVVGRMQASRLGQTTAWNRVEEQAASGLPDGMLVEGRTLRYWRDMFAWRVSTPRAAAKMPLLRVWGGNDALVPQSAYAVLSATLAGQIEPLCDWRMDAADHGLQTGSVDGMQLIWPRLVQWAKAGRLDCPGAAKGIDR